VDSVRQNSVIDRVEEDSDNLATVRRGLKPVLELPDSDSAEKLQFIFANRRLIYKVAIRSFVVSLILVLLLPPEYESSVSIMPPDSSSDMGSMMAAVMGKGGPEIAALAGGLFGMQTTGALVVDLLQSRTVQYRIVDRFNLQKLYSARYKESARKTLNRRTEVKEDHKSGVIRLTVMDHSPWRAHDMAQAYVEELNRIQAEVSTSSARRERLFIEQRLTSVKAELEDAEKQFSTYSSKNATLDIKDQAKAMVEAAAALEGQMIAAQSELQGLEQIYTPANVRVRAAQARIEELRKQLQRLDGTGTTARAGSSDSDELYPSIRQLPLLGVEWADLYRRVKVQETVFELLTQKYELARLQEAKEVANINVIDFANVPEKKSGPHRVLIVLGVTFISMVAAIAWIVGSARVQQLENDDPRKIIYFSLVAKINQLQDRCAEAHVFRWIRNGVSTLRKA
jgi:capsule polysaccharide export protein KpsE/RkpR